jgi:glycosyltransferase AglD
MPDVAVENGAVEDGAKTGRRGATDLAASFALAYAVGAGLLVALLHNAGMWSVAAYTRLLDIAITAGVVQLHDAQPGFLEGVPELELFQKSQEPIDMLLVALAGALLLAHWFLKSAQFHSFGAMVGHRAGFGQSACAYLYGNGLNRFTPYNFGQAATVSAVQGQGATVGQGSQMVYLSELFVLLEIAVFGLIGLLQLGLTTWLTMLVWPVGVLAVAYFWARPLDRRVSPVIGPGGVRDAAQAVRALVQRPGQALKAAALSIIAFGLKEASVFLVMMALTTQLIILTIETPMLLMAVVGGYVARLVPITPGGLGQFELGFAGGLYLAGAELAGVVTIVMFHTVVRYVVGSLLFGVVTVGFRVPTSFARALALFRSPAPTA